MTNINKLKAIFNKTIKPIDFIGESVDKYSKEILKYTPQLYTKQSKDTINIIPEAKASGVLIEVQKNKFLITAGHFIVSNDVENIGIMIEEKFYILNGAIKYINPYESEEADKIDIAAWKLDDDVVNDLSKKYSFLPYEDIDFNHIVSSKPQYLIVGFPWLNTIVKRATSQLIVTPFIFITQETEKKNYKRLKFNEQSSILLDYRQKKVKNIRTGMVQANKCPEGISGCGVWYLPTFIIKGQPKPKLVGQIIEQDKSKTILISTRIHIIMGILRSEFKLDISE